MLNWIIDAITLPRIIAFVLGLLAGQLISCVVSQHRRRTGREPTKSTLNNVVGVVIIVAMVWIMIATQQARNCALTLNKSLQVEITAGKMERESFQNAITKSLTLPKEIQDLDQQDPRRKAFTDPIRDQYLAEQKRAAKLREDNQVTQQKAQKACGK